MNYTILISKSAILDIHDSMEWYNAQKQDLGKAFYEAFKTTARSLTSNPMRYRKRFRTIRKAKIAFRFPFFIYFIVDKAKKEVTIIGVLHGGRNPQIWKERAT